MSVCVQKFGGTSVGSPERIQRIAEIVGARKREGNDVVVVVSAMGDTTDELLRLASQITSHPSRRELDMLLTAGERISMALLSMALHADGFDAISFTGSQSGIITDDSHTRARILEVRPHRIAEELGRGRIVIVAGFQGVSGKKEVTTLGRGGSDTTAVALAAAFGAKDCEIYTDVPGVMTADPRRVPTARSLERIPFDQMLEMAVLGAQVLYHRSVMLARRLGVPIVVRSSFVDEPHTRVEGETSMEGREVTAIAVEEKVLFLRVTGTDSGTGDRSGASAAGKNGGNDLFAKLAALSLEPIHAREEGRGTSMCFVLRASDPIGTLAKVRDALGASWKTTVGSGLGLVSIVGSGVLANPLLWEQVSRALERIDVRPEATFYSPLSIGLLIGTDRLDDSAKALHAELLERT